jgi:hypothetical protein
VSISCFGCSFTWGAELTDRDSQSWPAVLATQLGVEVNNYGVCGSSNQAIARNLMTHLIDNTPELVVVMWTYPARYEFVLDNKSFVSTHCDSTLSLTPNYEVPDYFESFRNLFFKQIATLDSYLIYTSLMAIHHSQLLLESKGIPYIFCPVAVIDTTSACEPTIDQLYKNYYPDMLLFDGLDAESYARSIDNWGVSHPLELAQEHIGATIADSAKFLIGR